MKGWVSVRVEIITCLVLLWVFLVAEEGSPAPSVSRLWIDKKICSHDTHCIVVPDRRTPSEDHAASELRDYLYTATGERLDILRDSEPTAKTPIVVGNSALIDRLGVRIPYAKLGDDGIVIKSTGDSLILTGNKRGVLYAVYTFLEDYIGFKWLTPSCTVTPKARDIRIPKLDVQYVPQFTSRSLDYISAFDQDWAVHSKVNGYGYAKRSSIDEAHGGEIAFPGWEYFWSTIRLWVTFEKYRDTHPEYFSELNGHRVTTNDLETDYCMTNPDVARIVIDGVKDTLKKHPDATMISVSQNDTADDYCRCPNCTALTRENGSPSAILIYLVNQVASAIESEFPNVKITTLGYHWAQKPPSKIKPHRNVIVEVCPILVNQRTPFASQQSEYARQLRQDVDGWVKICSPGNVKMVQYSINYANLFLPHPNLHIYGPNMKYFAKHGAGQFYDCGSYKEVTSDFGELRAYLIAKLAWNPSCDPDKVIDEFLKGYYGEAAGPIREYIDLLRRHVLGCSGMYLGCYAEYNQGQVTPEILNKADALFDDAESAVLGNTVMTKRVKIARLPLLNARVMNASEQYDYDGGVLKLRLPKYMDEFNKFRECIKDLGVSTIADVRIWPPEQWESEVRARLNADRMEVISLRSQTLEALIVPTCGGRMWKLTYLPRKRDVLGYWGINGDSAVKGRGYDEYSDLARRYDEGADSSVRFEVVERMDDSITMTANLKNGLLCTRTISLDPREASVTIKTTLTNPSDKAIHTEFMTHPVVSVSGGKKHIELLKDGKCTQRADFPEGTSVHTTVSLPPTGDWQIVDETRGMRIRNTFDPASIQECLVWYDTQFSDGVCTLELRAKPHNIQPNQSFEFKHTYRVCSK